MDQADKTEVVQLDLDWQHTGESFIAWWANDTSGHQGRNSTYRWAHDQGVDAIAHLIHECETQPEINKAKLFKTLLERMMTEI